MTDTATNKDHGRLLLAIARAAISNALGYAVSVDEAAPWLQERAASFVTLMRHGELRGCIGSVVARRSLLEDVKANARAAAFRDPRFAPLEPGELETTRIEVSVLSALEPLPARSEADALAHIRPHVDGVVLEWGPRHGTFLPQVWEALPNPRDFLDQLKLKAGLPLDFWADDIRLYRYQVVKWREAELAPEVV